MAISGNLFKIAHKIKTYILMYENDNIRYYPLMYKYQYTHIKSYFLQRDGAQKVF